jgi:tetratricopeptide (TPR) repeat protein
VNREIEAFRALSPQHQDRILAVLLDGEPSSVDPETRCFPPALLAVGPSDRVMGPRYPLAADLRPGRDRIDDAELRLIATLLGSEFQELKRREQEHRIARLRTSLAIMATVLIAFAALTGYALLERRQARVAEDRAKVSRTEAEKLVDFMLTDLRRNLELIGKLDLLEPANEMVRSYYESMAPMEDDVEVLRRRGEAFHQYAIDLRNHKKGVKTLQVLLTAAALRERVAQLRPGDSASWNDLAETRRFVAIQRRDDGEYDQSMEDLELAVAALRRAVALKPADLLLAARVPSMEVERAAALMRIGKTKEAATIFAGALRDLEVISSKDPGNDETRNRVAGTTWHLGNAYRRLGEYEKAEASYRKGIDIGMALRASGKVNIFSLRWLKTNQGGLGQLLQESGHYDQAVPALRSSLKTARDVLALDPTNLAYADDVATDLDNLADALSELKKPEEALPVIRESVGIRQEIVSKGATDLRSRNTLALALSTYSAVEIELKNYPEAIAAARKGVEVEESVSKSASADVRLRDDLGFLRSKLGDALLAAKNFPEAVNEYRTAIRIMDEILAKEGGAAQASRKAEKAEWQLGLGTALLGAAQRSEGESALRACLGTLREAETLGSPASRSADTRLKAETQLRQLDQGFATGKVGTGA